MLRIVYLGTPDFAVESLRRIVEEGFNVVGVVTAPDKPVGRHQNRLEPSPVKQYALEHGLPLLQPANLKDPAFVEQLRALRADVQVVVAFRMLPEVVWSMPRLGTFNLHASLLPQYRGAAPINWAIMDGQKETGVTTFFLKHTIDTGDIIDQVRVPIAPDENCGQLHDRLMLLGGDLVVKTLHDLESGKPLPTTPQPTDDAQLRPAPKIFRDTCRIDWSKGLEQAHNQVRGLSPVPGAWTMLRTAHGEDTLKIYAVTPCPGEQTAPTGSLRMTSDGRLLVAVPGGALQIDVLQMAGKRRMTTEEFLRGFHPSTDDMVL